MRKSEVYTKMASNKEDLRIIKTRAALSTTFFKLLADMELNEITVNKLCEESGVRRATFYKHFKDKDDFIIFIIKDIRSRFEANVWNKDQNPTFTKEYYHKYTEALIAFLTKHEAAMMRVATPPIRSTFINVFLQQNYEDTKSRLEASERSGMRLPASADMVASMMIGGTAHCLIRWFETEDRCSPDELLRDISCFIDRILA